jgi:hypothetical protein
MDELFRAIKKAFDAPGLPDDAARIVVGRVSDAAQRTGKLLRDEQWQTVLTDAARLGEDLPPLLAAALTACERLDNAARRGPLIDTEELKSIIARLEAPREELSALKRLAEEALKVREPDPAHAQLSPRTGEDNGDQFLDHSTKQRKLLLALCGKGKVSIDSVLREVYGSTHRGSQDALQGLVKRTNKRLAENQDQREIRKRGETYELASV